MAGVKLGSGATVLFFGVVDPTAEAVVGDGLRWREHPARHGPGTCEGPRLFTEYPAKGRATGGVRAHSFLKGEDRLTVAWVDRTPPAGCRPDRCRAQAPRCPEHDVSGSGQPIDGVIGLASAEHARLRNGERGRGCPAAPSPVPFARPGSGVRSTRETAGRDESMMNSPASGATSLPIRSSKDTARGLGIPPCAPDAAGGRSGPWSCWPAARHPSHRDPLYRWIGSCQRLPALRSFVSSACISCSLYV